MSQFITNPLDQIIDHLVGKADWDSSDLDVISSILMRSGDVNHCVCSRMKRVDDDYCPHHDKYPMDNDDA